MLLLKGHQKTQVAFKNFASFTKCVAKLMETNIIYNLIEYNSNYSETNGRLWFYSKNEATNFNADLTNTNNFKSFNYKAKLLANTEADGDGEI